MVKKEPPSEDEILQAFRACPILDKEEARKLCPEIVEVSDMLARCLSVDWMWALLALLAVAGAMIPQDRFEPAPSIEVPSSLWIVLLHPGATNTSGVIAVITKAVTALLRRMQKHEEREAKLAYDQQPESTRGDFTVPPLRQLLAGGASLAANGMTMSCKQNRGACLSAECEIEGVLNWFSNEASVDKGAPAKLWDSVAWHRPVMDKSRAFSVDRPWYAICAGAHVPELFKATLNDTFGLRERLTACFAEPLWLSIKDIRRACALLPVPSRKPVDFVAGLFFPLLRWSVARGDSAVGTFEASDVDGALELVDQKFDGHMDNQKDCFLRPGSHQQAKYHGKLRTKFDRMALSTHVLDLICCAFKDATSDPLLNLGEEWAPQFTVTQILPP